MKLGKYFTLDELTASQTATRRGIDNTPTSEAKANLEALVLNILDPLREAIGHPITVSSGYRSPALNKAIGGARNSDHMTGEAADINCPAIGIQALFDFIRNSKLPYDQVINEFGSWVHVSFTIRNRRQALVASRVGKRTVYKSI